MYEFQRLTREVRLLARRYECCRLSEVGKSLCGRPLYLLRVGSGEIPVLYAGAFHGLEGITAALLVHFCRRLCQAQESGLTPALPQVRNAPQHKTERSLGDGMGRFPPACSSRRRFLAHIA